MIVYDIMYQQKERATILCCDLLPINLHVLRATEMNNLCCVLTFCRWCRCIHSVVCSVTSALIALFLLTNCSTVSFPCDLSKCTLELWETELMSFCL